MDGFTSNNPIPFQSLGLPEPLRVLVLAPHPDDSDAIGVTLRFLWENGNPLFVAVVTSGASGVEDTFCSPPTVEARARLREQEQRASCQFFGLPRAHLAFLRLEEDESGHPVEDEASNEI